ncbi:MAG: hypothetical protein ACRCUS_06620 [Anaerovoracaceae bacterium]
MKSSKLCKKYKKNLIIKEYHSEQFLDYLKNRYNYTNTIEEYKTTFHYKTLVEKLISYTNGVGIQELVFLEVAKDEKSIHLYDGTYTSGDNIYVFIDKISGFFETNSFDLRYELAIERGISQESYDNETQDLLDALIFIDDYMFLKKVRTCKTSFMKRLLYRIKFKARKRNTAKGNEQ